MRRNQRVYSYCLRASQAASGVRLRRHSRKSKRRVAVP